MPAIERDILIEQGATFRQVLPIDKQYASGWTGRGFVRSSFVQMGYQGWTRDQTAPALLIAAFTVDLASQGNAILGLTPAITAALYRPAWARRDEYSVRIGFYDVELTNGIDVIRAYRGQANLAATISSIPT